jgi:hypothetical protein
MSPRWTYSENNAKTWRLVFDELLQGDSSVELPVTGNAKTAISLKIRIGDALKWLADQWQDHGNEAFRQYAELKKRIRYGEGIDCLRLTLRPLRPAFRHVGPKGQARSEPVQYTPDILAKLAAKMMNPDTAPELRLKLAKMFIRESQGDQAKIGIQGFNLADVVETAQKTIADVPRTV